MNNDKEFFWQQVINHITEISGNLRAALNDSIWRINHALLTKYTCTGYHGRIGFPPNILCNHNAAFPVLTRKSSTSHRESEQRTVLCGISANNFVLHLVPQDYCYVSTRQGGKMLLQQISSIAYNCKWKKNALHCIITWRTSLQ
jgi:hypothetical protein